MLNATIPGDAFTQKDKSKQPWINSLGLKTNTEALVLLISLFTRRY